MITIRNRRMIVPKEERYLGVFGDDYASVRVFSISRNTANDIDISALSFSLDFEYKDGTTNTTVLQKIVNDDNVILTWDIIESDLRVEGTVLLQLHGNDLNGTVQFACFTEPFYIGELIDVQRNYTGELSAYEALLTRCIVIEDAEANREADFDAEKDAFLLTKSGEIDTAKTALIALKSGEIDTEKASLIAAKEIEIDAAKDAKIAEVDVEFQEKYDTLEVVYAPRLTTVESQLAEKAKQVDFDNQQAQINAIVLQGTSGDSSAEVAGARVGINNQTYATLKARLDAETIVRKISKTGINNTTAITSFPNGVVSAVSIGVADSAGFPTSYGTLETYRLGATDDYSFQLWHAGASNNIYLRRFDYNGVATNWEEALDKAGHKIISKYGITNASLITAFPSKTVSVTTFSVSDNAGFPTSAGTLETYRLGASDDFSFQIWYDATTDCVYKRRFDVNGNPLRWGGENIYKNISSYGITNSSNVSAFPSGSISIANIGVINNGCFPTRAGVLETYKIGTSTDFYYQIWYDVLGDNIYRRRFNSDGTGKEWIDIGNPENIKAVNKVENTTREPVAIFVTDDGTIYDYTILKPLSVTYNVPFVTAVPSNYVGGTLTGMDCMSQEQLLELQNTYGWEIASHTNHHVVLTDLTESQIESELYTSKVNLRNMGLNVNNLVYPQGRTSELVRRVAKKYYNCACRVEDSQIKVHTGFIPSYYIARTNLGAYFDPAVDGYPATNTLEYYKTRVDEAIAGNGLVVFELHTWSTDFDATQQSYLEQTIQYIKSLGVKILTLHNAFKIFGNAFESGDYIGHHNVTGIAIDKMGNYDIPRPWLNKTGIDNSTPITSFEKDRVICLAFGSWDNAGFPTVAGTLEIHRQGPSNDFGYQLWYSAGDDKIYKRGFNLDGTPRAWKLIYQ